MASPIVTAAISYTLNRVRVFFSEPMINLSTAGNFSIPGLTVTVAAASADRTYTDLTTTGMVTGTNYTVTVSSPPVDNDTLETLAVATASFDGATSPSDLTSLDELEMGHEVGNRLYGGLFLTSDEIDVRKATLDDLLVVEVFHMRAFRSLTPGYVYWTTFRAADFIGNSSGYPPGELSDIVLIATC